MVSDMPNRDFSPLYLGNSKNILTIKKFILSLQSLQNPADYLENRQSLKKKTCHSEISRGDKKIF